MAGFVAGASGGYTGSAPRYYGAGSVLAAFRAAQRASRPEGAFFSCNVDLSRFKRFSNSDRFIFICMKICRMKISLRRRHHIIEHGGITFCMCLHILTLENLFIVWVENTIFSFITFCLFQTDGV